MKLAISLLLALMLCGPQPILSETDVRKPSGRVRVMEHSFVDGQGAFLGLGATYFTALWRHKNDRPRLERDLAFLSQQGFNYYRMLSMVGYYPAWDGLEIAPVPFKSKDGKSVPAWPDYWAQLGALIDLAFDKYSLRTHITIFADAQLMPGKEQRIEHMRKLFELVVRGRESKIILLEVANEAWQNGFPGDQGIADLREFTTFLTMRTDVPVAITSNHDLENGFEKTYLNSDADLATWHFNRDRRAAQGWQPVIDCWDFAVRPGFPPVISNEPIGPGASVASEKDPLRLVMAAAFAYAAKLPAYVFHSEAGVFGKARFEETAAINQFRSILRLLPPDLPSWNRRDGKAPDAPLRVLAGGEIDRYTSDTPDSKDGCLLNSISQKGDLFICMPIAIKPGGLEIQARTGVRFTIHDPFSGESLQSVSLSPGERTRVPPGPGALIIKGRVERVH